MSGNSVGRTLSAVLLFQVGIGVFLVAGDLREGAFALPRFGPEAPRLTEPVRPGDQRRTFRPGRDRPAIQPARDPGELPDRLTLSQDTDGSWRLEGGVAEGDAERIIGLIATSGVDSLILQSPGGSVRDALAIGRYLRQAGIATRMLPGEFCYSACPYLLAGGATREIDPAASVGVHQHYFGENTLLPAFVAVEDIQFGQGEVMAYLEEMDIDLRLMRHALTTPPDQIYVLLQSELRDYGFLTEQEAET